MPGTSTPPHRPDDSKTPQQPPRPQPQRQQRQQPRSLPGHHAVVLVTGALMIYFGTLWLGVIVIGDTPLHSAIMAALILAIATTGYMFNRRPTTPEE